MKRQRVYYSNMLQKTGRYEEVALEIQGCNAAIAWMANPQPFNIKNEKEVNTGFSEFAGLSNMYHVYYTGEVSKGSKTPHLSWTGKSFLKVYKADHNVEGLQNSVILEEFNEDKKYHVGPVSSDKAGKEFFVTRTYAGKDGERVKEGKKRFHIKSFGVVYIHQVGSRLGIHILCLQ